MPISKTTTPTLTELFNAQRNGHVLANNQGEDQRWLDRKRAAYALKVAERENFLRFYDAGAPDVVLRLANGGELALRLSPEASGAVYSAIHEGLVEALREQEAVIIGEMLRLEKDASVGENEQERVHNTYESTILALCTPAAMSNVKPVTETSAPASLPVLPAGQRLFVTPPTRPAAPTV